MVYIYTIKNIIIVIINFPLHVSNYKRALRRQYMDVYEVIFTKKSMFIYITRAHNNGRLDLQCVTQNGNLYLRVTIINGYKF